MENKSSVGRYMLVFEPKYESSQFAVYFRPDGDVQVTRVKKYSDVICEQNKKGTVKKNVLSELDKKLTPLTDTRHFFEEYVSPSIFRYQGHNLHRMFIGYKNGNYMNCLRCSFNNQELLDKATLASGNKISDYFGVNDMIKLLTDPDSQFLSFVINTRDHDKKHYYLSSVSESVLGFAVSLRNVKKEMKAYCESGMIDECHYLEGKLHTSLSSYKDYREMLIMKQGYIDYLSKQKSELKTIKEEVVQAKKQTFQVEQTPPITEQLSFFNCDYGSQELVKTKNPKNG